VDLGQLDAGMEPGPVCAEQDLVRAGPAQRLLEQIEAPHARGVGVDVVVAHEVVDQGELCRPVVGEAAEVRDDEGDVGIFLRQQLDDRHLADDVIEHGDPEGAGSVADLAADPADMTMNLDADEAVALDGRLHHRCDAAAIALGIDEGEAVEAAGLAGHDAGHFPVGHGVV